MVSTNSESSHEISFHTKHMKKPAFPLAFFIAVLADFSPFEQIRILPVPVVGDEFEAFVFDGTGG